MNDDEPTAPNLLTQAVEALLQDDERWRVEPTPGVTMVMRGWPDGTVDTLMLLSPDLAYGIRRDPQGGEPWSMGPAPAEHILYHARRLLPPDDPDAPKPLRSDRRNLPEADWR